MDAVTEQTQVGSEGGQQQAPTIPDAPVVESSQTAVAEGSTEQTAVSEADVWRREAQTYRDKTFDLVEKIATLEEKLNQVMQTVPTAPKDQFEADPVLGAMQDEIVMYNNLVDAQQMSPEVCKAILTQRYSEVKERLDMRQQLELVTNTVSSGKTQEVSSAIRGMATEFGIQAGSDLDKVFVSTLQQDFGIDPGNPAALAALPADKVRQIVHYATLGAREKFSKMNPSVSPPPRVEAGSSGAVSAPDEGIKFGSFADVAAHYKARA